VGRPKEQVRLYPEVLAILKQLQEALNPQPYIKDLASLIILEALLNPSLTYTVLRHYFGYSQEKARTYAWYAHDLALNFLKMVAQYEEAKATQQGVQGS